MLAPFALVALLPAAGTAPRPSPEDLYRRVVARALERAQADLVGALDLWVDHSRWENPWVATTEHYEVRTTESYALAAEMAGSLEYLRGEWVKLLGAGTATGSRGSGSRSKVWIFPNIGAYNQFGQQFAEHSSMYGSFYAGEHAEQPVAAYFTPNRTLLGMWITHGATHQFVEQSFGAEPPLWISEGLASYFALHWDWGARELQRLATSRAFIPLEHLLADPIQAYVANSSDRFVELGMLFHYLLSFCEDTKTGAGGQEDAGPFRDFLRAAVRGQDVSRTDFGQNLEEASGLLEADFKSFDFGAH